MKTVKSIILNIVSKFVTRPWCRTSCVYKERNH